MENPKVTETSIITKTLSLLAVDMRVFQHELLLTLINHGVPQSAAAGGRGEVRIHVVG